MIPLDPITIAIPYYRGHAYLREAIDSVRAQTVSGWRVVVVDDAGPEPADELVAGYADPRITCVRHERNLGLSGNWNSCLRLAETPLVTLLHADDRLHPRYVETVTSVAARHPEVPVVFTDVTVIGDDGEPTTTLADRVKQRISRRSPSGLLRGDDDLALLLYGDYVVCPTMCYRPALLPADPFDTTMRQAMDWKFVAQLFIDGHSVYHVAEPLLEYRRHGGQMTSHNAVGGDRFVEELTVAREYGALAARKGWRRAARVGRARVTVRGHIVVSAGLDLLRGRLGYAWAKLRLLARDLAGKDLTGGRPA